jgi:ferric-dicitrate binding protein FerR (iron transport regulator)
MGKRRELAIVACLAAALTAACAIEGASAQQAIGSTALSRNQVTRELAGASGALAVGDSVYLNEAVRTGADSLAKLVFVDSTNLSVGPTSRVVLDRFVYEGDPSGQKVAVGLAKGLFRFTTGTLDKKAYTINTPTAAIGVRGTVLDIDVRSADTRVTLVEGRAIVCPRKPGVTLDRQARACGSAFSGGGARGGHCDCAEILHPGETAQVKRVAGSNQASLTSNTVNFASLCAGDSSLCSSSDFAFAGGAGGGALCGR